MTIYVDPPRHYPDTKLRFKWWSHMVSDTSAEELHAFAEKLGLKREWSQNGPHHYDITPTKRNLALKLGAKPVTLRELAKQNYDGHFKRTAARKG